MAREVQGLIGAFKANEKKSAKAELDELAKLGAKFPQHQEVAELLKSL